MTSALLVLLLGFGSPDDFATSAVNGGGNGGRFTGSPSDRWTCAVCHDTPGRNPVSLGASGRDLGTTGYVPGETYELEIATGADAARSAFALEISTRQGTPAGALTAAPPPVGAAAASYLCAGVDPVVTSDGVVAQSYSCAVSRWRVTWQAPAQDVGSVTAFLVVVDADGNSRSTGDVTTALIQAIPSPSTAGTTPQSCGSAGGGLALGGLALGGLALGSRWRRRLRGLAVLAMLSFVAVADGAPRKKPSVSKRRRPASKKARPVETAGKPSGADTAGEQRGLDLAGALTPTDLGSGAPAAPAGGASEGAGVGASGPTLGGSARAGGDVPAALELEVLGGFGFRSLALSSMSYATPFRVSFGYPTLAFGLTVVPAHLLRSTALSGLHFQAQYAVGWAVARLPLGGAESVPSDGRVALGYGLQLGSLRLTPRAVYRILVGGVERNALFDDFLFQSVGGELELSLLLRELVLTLVPRGGVVVDPGTLPVRGYGASRGGMTFGGSASVAWRFASGLSIGASYSLSLTRIRLAGHGVRDFEAMGVVDVVQGGLLLLRVER